MNNFLTYIEDFISEIKSPDNALTIKFFLYFSRFEYAMKSSGFSSGKNADGKYTDPFKANWDSLGDILHSNSNLLEKLNIPTLIKYPPKKMVSPSGFEEVNRNKIDFKEILLSVTRVRNNLFHGGKFSNSEFNNTGRNITLLKESLIILKFIIENKELQFENCEKLRECFLY